MTTDLELDRILSGWLAEGEVRLPTSDLGEALEQVHRTSQRRGLGHWRAVPAVLELGTRVAALGVFVAVLTAAAAWMTTRPVQLDVGQSPTYTLDARWARGVAAPEVAFTALLPTGTARDVYWRTAAYDTFDLDAWSQSVDASATVRAGESLLPGSAEIPPAALTTPIRAIIQPGAFREPLLLSPGTPVRVDAAAGVRTVGADAWLAAVEIAGADRYTVDARLLRLSEDGPVSPAGLRAATSVYPSDITEHYTAVPAGALGPDARRLLASILASTSSRDPYDLAVAIEAQLEGPDFRYDVTPAPCADASLVECFARTRSGYCLHYASTMAILLRSALPENPVPTRVVQGFLPGERSGSTETVTNLRAHAWVEVYFEGVGWVPFDPTPVGSPTVTTDGVSPSGSIGP